MTNIANSAYLSAQGKARGRDRPGTLAGAGWIVQSRAHVSVGAGPGVAVREFSLDKPHGRAQPKGRMLSGAFAMHGALGHLDHHAIDRRGASLVCLVSCF